MPDSATNNIKKLGRYDIVRVLGKGAMGVVYEARDPNLNRKVAIKTVRVDSLSKEEAAEYELRFRTEAHSAARLQHPNIVSVYDSDRDGSTPFLVMEFVKGEDLKHYLDSGQRYSLEQSVRMMRDLLAALDYAHQRKIIHRDIKPANLLIEADGRVKLTDFGVARIQDSGEATRTQGGMVGTLKYMAPEQVEGKSADALSDLFSAGIVLYQLLTDRRPFDGDSYFSIVNQITNQHPPAPSSINRMLTSAVDAVVARALAKDKNQRFATAQDFSLALQAAARRADPTITPLANPYKIIEPTGTGSHERSGSTASTLTNTVSTVTQELELVYWKDVKDSDDQTDLEGFLARFPEGVYADLAKRRLKRIAQAQAELGKDLYDRTVIAPEASHAPEDVLTDFTIGIADPDLTQKMAANSTAAAVTAEAAAAVEAPAEQVKLPVEELTEVPFQEPVAMPVEAPVAKQELVSKNSVSDESAQQRPVEPIAKAGSDQFADDLTMYASKRSASAPAAETPAAAEHLQEVAAAPADLAAVTPAPLAAAPQRKKTALLVGLAAVVVCAVGLWAWQGQGKSNKVITESSVEAGLGVSPALPGASAASSAASRPGLTATLAAGSSLNGASQTATLSPDLASMVPAASQPNSSTTATIAAPKSASSAAKALAAAKQQALRDAAAAKAGSTVSQPAFTPHDSHGPLHTSPATHAPPPQASAQRPAPAPTAAPAPSRARDSAVTGPQEACTGKGVFGYGSCLFEQCARAVFHNHPFCIDQRERQERTRN